MIKAYSYPNMMRDKIGELLPFPLGQIGMSTIAHAIAGILLPVLKVEMNCCPIDSMELDRPRSGMAHPAAALVRGCQLGRRNGCLDATPNAAA